MNSRMDEALVEEIMSFISEIRSKGQNEDHLLTELMKEYEGTKDDFIHFIEMMMIGAFRADILSSGMLYPEAYLGLEEHTIMKTAFRLRWIALKGPDHYQKNYVEKRKQFLRFIPSDF